MHRITITLEPSVALFYTRIALSSGLPLEQVLSDALFKLAGELSLEALQASERTK
jgi:antitoxin component of RelBE/YafQ-DinJ toxin-antitoxin module